MNVLWKRVRRIRVRKRERSWFVGTQQDCFLEVFLLKASTGAKEKIHDKMENLNRRPLTKITMPLSDNKD